MTKGKKKSKSKARPKKTKKKQKSFLLFPKFFQKWSLIFIGLFALLGLLASLNFPRLTMEKNMTSTDETTVAFIAEIGETSRYLAARNDLYASVMIAQAILESDSGQSTLSQKPSYNFFGIKGDYNGQSGRMMVRAILTILMRPFVLMALWKILYRTMWTSLRGATM